jgi:hypothetical protein
MRSLALMLPALILLAGCATEPAAETATPAPPAAAELTEFAVEPEQLLEAARQAIASPPLSLAIEEEHKGVLVTGWQEFPGDWHIARHWLERTRYRITIIPDFDDRTGHSRLQIVAETQERAPTVKTWHWNAELQRPERSAEVLRQIQQRLK